MSRLQANLLLLVAAAMWGVGNVAQKTILDHVDAFSAAGLRSLIGGLLVAPLLLCIKEAANNAKGWWQSLFRVSSLFALALIVQQVAYLDSSVTNASFLVNTDVVFTPLFAWLMLRTRPSPPVYLAVVLVFCGLCLMSGGVLAGFGSGDLIALASAVLYALWMVELERHMRRFGRPIATSVAQFLGTAVLALPLGAVGGGISVVALREAAPELIVLGVFSTALGPYILIIK